MTTVAHRLRLVQLPDMGKVDAPYLTSRPGAKGSTRWFFQPPTRDKAKGWAAVRLHDQFQRPIADALEAATACKPLADIYTKWRAGVEGYGPHMIDRLGRVVAPVEKSAKIRRKEARGRNFKPGQVGAMVHDYKLHEVFTALKPKTQLEYRTYLAHLVDEFGDTYWWQLTAGAARKWLRAWAIAHGPAGAHSLYRTCRSFFRQCRLIYTELGHPGIVPDEKNPFLSLNLSLPTATLIVWPKAAVDAFVALADELGQPSIGDAVTMMAWLSTRKQDWIKWPATHFDKPLLAFRQEKTGQPLVLPWDMVPALQARVTAAKARRTADAVTARTFFHDQNGLPWRDGDAFRDAFNLIRDVLEQRHPTFATRYYVGILDEDPMLIPTGALTTRTLRHTCVTLNHDAGIPRELIAGLTGHSLDTIDEVMACYTASTADQAAAALQMRMDHEAKGAKA